MQDNHSITKKERDCLIAIGRHFEDRFPVRLSDLSRELGVKNPTALNLVKRLEFKEMALDDKGMILLTETGVNRYKEVQENHRIMETLMVKHGVDLTKACEISQHVDYLMDHPSVDTIFENLGKPSICPHGRNIEQYH